MNEFVQILQAAYKTIKAEDPSAKVVLSGFGSSKLDQIFYSEKKGPQAREKIINLFKLAKNFYDILDIHLYHNPDDVGGKIELAQRLMEEAGYSVNSLQNYLSLLLLYFLYGVS
ncbi:MAG: hypothetical protein QXX95_00665 [Nitrososphaerales archaeon]